MSINVVLHYGGKFVNNLILEYEGGEKSVVAGQDLDKWSYFEAAGLVNDLGFKEGSYRLWWKGEQDIVFRTLLCDEDALSIAEHAVMFKGDGHIYVEHIEQPGAENDGEETDESEDVDSEDDLKGIHMDDSEEERTHGKDDGFGIEEQPVTPPRTVTPDESKVVINGTPFRLKLKANGTPNKKGVASCSNQTPDLGELKVDYVSEDLDSDDPDEEGDGRRRPKYDQFRKSVSKTFWLILSLVAIISSSALIASVFNQPISLFHLSSSTSHLCEHALDTESCLIHVSEIATKKDNKLNILLSLLTKSTTQIQNAKDTANAIKNRINSPREEAALRDCEELMDLSIDRVYDSMVALTKNNIDDAHTWLSTVLTNHATCLDGLDGISMTLLKTNLEDLISKARTSLAVFVATFPSKGHSELHDETLYGEFPSWVSSKDRKLLESSVGDIKANVVVAKDGSGKFKTVAEAVASAPDNGKARYVIYVKRGTYKENVEIVSKKTNVMLVGDGMDATIITGNLNFIDGTTTFKSATLAAVGAGFIAQDIWIQNSAGPEKHQAVALRGGSDQSVINRCRIDAYQDTLYAHSNRQFYRDSFITGTVDFIFGNATVVFQKCKIVARKPMSNQNNVVTAQGREDPNQNTATSIQQCEVIASSDLKPVVGSIKTFLGRPWKKFSRTVFLQSTLDSHIDPTGWAEWDPQSKDFLQTLYYGEYMNSGRGAGTGKRVNWPGFHVITNAGEASKFTVGELIQGNVWLKNTGVAITVGL